MSVTRLPLGTLSIALAALLACESGGGDSKAGGNAKAGSTAAPETTAQPDAAPAEDGGGTDDGEAPAADGGGEGEGEGGHADDGDLGEPEPDQEVITAAAPEGYGDYNFKTDPLPESELINHAQAGYGVVAIYADASKDSKKIGFLRLGQRLRAGAKVKNGDCRKGWYPLEGGGWACASKGLTVGKKPPFMKDVPPPPKDEPFPYNWAYVKRWNSPMWWRVPSADERKRAEKKRLAREAERTGTPLDQLLAEAGMGPKPAAAPKAPTPAKKDPPKDPAPKKDPPKKEGETGPAGDLSKLPGVDDPAPKEAPPKKDPPKEDPPKADPPKEDPAPAKADPPKEEPAVPEEPPPPLPLSPDRSWLEKGYFLSVGSSFRDKGKGYWRTARGGVVAQSDAYKYGAKDFQGAPVTDEMSFPVGFVMKKKGAKLYEMTDEGKARLSGSAEKRTFFDFEQEIELHGTAYMQIRESGKLIKKKDVVLPDQRGLPKGLKPYDRWIDVDLTKQLLVAYEGTKPVYVTLVSTGKKGSEEEPFDTPEGRYRIYSKQITSNMDGSTASDGNYAIQDVPWVMYFEGNYALHGAFWHRSFGHVRSHGCVNLGPSDARWLFHWTTPFVPDLWHGAHSTDDNPGSTVIVRRSDAK